MCTESEAKHANIKRRRKGEKILCMMAPRVKFLSFLIVQLSLFRTVGLLLKKKEKRNLKRKFKCF